ncbi:MAG: DNA polymerase III subunit delta [Oscillospiraceae bacterium]
MIYDDKKLDTALKTINECNILYFYSTDDFLLDNAVKKVQKAIGTDGEITKIDGPVPNIETLAEALGVVSFFGGRRIIILDKISPSEMTDDDVNDLCNLILNADGTLVVVTTLFKDDKAKITKKAKQIQQTAEKKGISADFVLPNQRDTFAYLTQLAQELNTKISSSAASQLVDFCGMDLMRLKSEVEKLAALCGYTEILPEHILRISTKNIEADVFQMIDFVTTKNTKKAFEKLSQLIYLQNEPIAITAALSGSFIDMYRVKCGSEKNIGYAQVFKEMGYKGNDYRLKKALERANKYSTKQLGKIIQILFKLDIDLKSSKIDNIVLLQTALAQCIIT